MSGAQTTVGDGIGAYRDSRLPDLELRWEGETFELWVSDHPATGHPMSTFLQRGCWTQAQVFLIFSKEEAPQVPDSLAHAVAQYLFDFLSHDSAAWREHVSRFGEHPGCDIETTCEACCCCATAGTPGCACPHCRCRQRNGATGHPFEPIEQRALRAARALVDSGGE
jgi:hypothetical protein